VSPVLRDSGSGRRRSVRGRAPVSLEALGSLVGSVEVEIATGRWVWSDALVCMSGSSGSSASSSSSSSDEKSLAKGFGSSGPCSGSKMSSGISCACIPGEEAREGTSEGVSRSQRVVGPF
jgi:hypothetical protein